MYLKLRQVFRCLFTLTQQKSGECRKGGLFVYVEGIGETSAIVTVLAGGSWGKELSECSHEAMERLSSQVPLCDFAHSKEFQKFFDIFGPVFFNFSFNTTRQSVKAEQSIIQRFLHRLGLIHAKLKITFKIWKDSKIQEQIFSVEPLRGLKVMDYCVSVNSAAYGLTPFSLRDLKSCPKMHPVFVDRLSCVLPTHTIEAGLHGEMSIVTMATLVPCMKQYPNWPTRLSCIQMLVYSPCGMPLMQQTQLHFLQSLSSSLPWEDLGLSKVSLMQTKKSQGLLYSEVEFSVESRCNQETRCSEGNQSQNTEPERSHAVEQTMIVFILTHYTDAFQTTGCMSSESDEVFERHLDDVFLNNEDQLRATLLSTMTKAVKRFQKRHTAKQRLDSALPVILSSVSKIIASSTNGEFRKTCFDSMKVESTCELKASLKQSLHRVVDGRLRPEYSCIGLKGVKSFKVKQSCTDSSKEELGEMSSKRPYSDINSSMSEKKHCPESLSDYSDPFEDEDILASPLSSQSQQISKFSETPSALSVAELNNEQVQMQWQQELEHFSEWD